MFIIISIIYVLLPFQLCIFGHRDSAKVVSRFSHCFVITLQGDCWCLCCSSRIFLICQLFKRLDLTLNFIRFGIELKAGPEVLNKFEASFLDSRISVDFGKEIAELWKDPGVLKGSPPPLAISLI